MLVDSNDPALIHGVSKQDPKDRAPGQCTEQINMLSEPVEGLMRRPGAKHKKVLSLLVDPNDCVYMDFTAQKKQFTLVVENLSGDTQCINETDGTLIPVYRETSSGVTLQNLPSSWTKIGDYLLIASKNVIVTTSTAAPPIPVKRYGVIEIRAGAYSAKYTVKITGVGDFTHTTPDGSVPAHVAQAQPEFIASALATLLAANATVLARWNITINGNTIGLIPKAPLPDNEAFLADIMMEDGFGNQRARYAFNIVRDTTTLPVWAPEAMGLTVGKGGEADGDYYLYFKQDTSAPDTVPRSGRWIEGLPANVNTVTVNNTWPTLAFVTPDGSGSYVCIIGNPAEIEFRYNALGLGTLVAPDWGSRTVGDQNSNPIPRFVGGNIMWCGVFQDRLYFLSGNTVTMSRTKDYLQFFRQTVVTLLDDDPANVSSTFGEAADLLAGVPFDRNLLITALGQQYILYGKSTITPKNISLLASSAFESSPICPPLAHGNFAYFATSNLKSADLQEVYTDGAFDTAVARSVSSHVDTYIPGDIDRLNGSTKLGMVLNHSKAGQIYVYRYLFNDTERVLSAWSKWVFGGTAVCRSARWDGAVLRLIFTDATHYFLAELDLAKTGVAGMSTVVYPDHWFEVALAGGHGSTVAITPTADQLALLATKGTNDIIIFDNENLELPWTLSGSTYTVKDIPLDATHVRFGIDAPAVWKPTMPVPRDQNGKVIGTATLIVGDMVITYTMGSEFLIEVDTKYGQHYEYEVTPRLAGTEGFTLGERAIGGGVFTFAVMADPDDSQAEVTVTVGGTSPLVISTLDWQGQLYKKGRRI